MSFFLNVGHTFDFLAYLIFLLKTKTFRNIVTLKFCIGVYLQYIFTVAVGNWRIGMSYFDQFLSSPPSSLSHLLLHLQKAASPVFSISPLFHSLFVYTLGFS